MFEDFYMPEFDANQRGIAAAEKVGSPYSMMLDEYNVPVGAMDSDVMLGNDMAMIAAPAPSRPVRGIVSPYAKPSATPALDFVTDRGGQQGYYFVTNAGRAAKTKANPTGFVSVDPNAQYRLVNERGQNVVVTSGTGEQGLRDAYAAAQRLSTEGGKKADWFLERSGPDGKWTRIADDDPKGSDLGVIGDIAGFALPIAAAILTGGASLPAQMAAAGLAGGVGGALAGRNPLKSALLSAGTAGLVGGTGLDKAIGGALSGVGGQAAGQTAGQAAGQVAGQAAGEAAGDIVVNALTNAALRAGAGIAQGGLQGAFLAANSGSPLSGGTGSSSTAGDVKADVLSGEAPIVVSAPEAIAPEVVSPVVSGIGGAIPGIESLIGSPEFQETVVDETSRAPEEEPTEPGIDVIGTKTIYPEPPAVPLVPIALPGLQTTPVSQPDLLADVNPEVPDERSILDTALDVADVASVVVPVAGGIVGGGGGGGGTIAPDTSGITFRPSTLRPTLTGGGSGGIGGISSYPYTPQTYGRAGGDQEVEYLFFTRDPAVEAPAVVPASAPGRKEGGKINDDMVKHLLEYRKGGGHHGPGPVKGIGSGQEDKIPAWLSDGEYVWSAQDVADLGDGSTDEGVRRLDKMREMVRRQAGRKNVKKIAKPQKGIDRMLKAVGGLA